MIKKFAAIALALIPTPTWAASWFYITNSDDTVVYAAPETAQLVGDQITIWFRYYTLGDTGRIRYDAVQSGVNCKDRTSVLLFVGVYDENGKSQASEAFPRYKQEHIPIIPDTVMWAIYQTLCMNGPSEKVSDPTTDALLRLSQ